MTEIVVDVGALAHPGGSSSVDVLAETYDPSVLFAFDPHPAFEESVSRRGPVCVVARRLAAWTYGGAVSFVSAGTGSRVVLPRASESDDVPWSQGERLDLDDAAPVQAFDFSAWLATLPVGALVKLDCEGAEYPILRSIHTRGLDARLSGILVEWHEEPLDLPFRCPVWEWTL